MSEAETGTERGLRLAEVAQVSDGMAATRSRNAKVALAAELLTRAATPPNQEAGRITAWLTGELPEGKIGLGYQTVKKVFEALGPTHPTDADLTVSEVQATITALASASGAGVNALRQRLLEGLFARATASERAFLAGLFLGEMRQGALDGVLTQALAKAFGAPDADVRRAVMLAGRLATVADALASGGREALGRFQLEVFRAVQPMLAETAEDVAAVAEVDVPQLVEAKLDGARVQAHKRGGEVRVFSRAGNDVTIAVPEVVAQLAALPVSDAILDGEVIALRPDGRPHPFQTTMRRFGRRLDIDALRDELPLTTFWFDLLRADGVDLLGEPLGTRRARLEGLLPGALTPAQRVEPGPGAAAEVQAFLDAVLAAGHEGVMCKRLDSAYSAGQRGAAWLKLKPAKTLDLVVIAVEQGSGRRSQWLSNLHLAARDETSDPTAEPRWVMLGKTFKGMTDELLAWQTRELSQREVRREGHVVHVRPELVVEIAFQELEASPRYPGGVALRFARVKGYRPDKSPAEADTLSTVLALFEGQR